jgi:hypothetical protein
MAFEKMKEKVQKLFKLFKLSLKNEWFFKLNLNSYLKVKSTLIVVILSLKFATEEPKMEVMLKKKEPLFMY